jgi:hypothetical protein
MDKKKQKKIQYLVERIGAIETEITLALTKKSHTSAEINVPAKRTEIQKLKTELATLTK